MGDGLDAHRTLATDFSESARSILVALDTEGGEATSTRLANITGLSMSNLGYHCRERLIPAEFIERSGAVTEGLQGGQKPPAIYALTDAGKEAVDTLQGSVTLSETGAELTRLRDRTDRLEQRVDGLLDTVDDQNERIDGLLDTVEALLDRLDGDQR